MGATKSQINKQNKIREKTNQELLQLLMTYHMANLIRPTGYGKTYHISSLVALFPNKNFLYLYPSEVVANAAKNSIITHAKITDPDVVETINSMSKFMNVTMMTYAMFSRQTPAEIKKIKAEKMPKKLICPKISLIMLFLFYFKSFITFLSLLPTLFCILLHVGNRVAFVHNLKAQNGFDDVFQRQNTLKTAVLVNDKGDLRLLL